MPTLDVDMCVIGQLNNENDAIQRVKVPMNKNEWIKVHKNEVSLPFIIKFIIRIINLKIISGVYNPNELPSLCASIK